MKKITVIAGIALLCAACTQTTEMGSILDPSEINLAPFNQPAVKSVATETTMPTTRTMRVSAIHTALDGTVSTYFEDALFSYKNNGWTGGKYWPVNGKLCLAAYSTDLIEGQDYTAEWNYNEDGSFSTILLKNVNNSVMHDDIMYSNKTLNLTCPQANPQQLKFYHASAYIKISFKATDADVASTITISKVTIKNITTGGDLTITVRDYPYASWSNPSEKADYSIPGSITLSTTAQEWGHAMTLPQNMTDIVIEYLVDGSLHTYTAALSKTDLWECGHRYSYTFNISRKEIACTATVNEWVNYNASNPMNL